MWDYGFTDKLDYTDIEHVQVIFRKQGVRRLLILFSGSVSSLILDADGGSQRRHRLGEEKGNFH